MASTVSKYLSEATKNGKSIYSSLVGKGLIAIRQIAEATGADSNKLAREYLSAEAEEILEPEYDYLVQLAILKVWGILVPHKAFKKSDLVPVENRPRDDRPIGDCYANAAKECRATGNPPVIGWMLCFVGNMMNIIPHAFNYDTRRKTYYDTDKPKHCDSLDERYVLSCYSLRETNKWFASPTDLPVEVGTFWLCVESDKKRVLMIHCQTTESGTPKSRDKVIYAAAINDIRGDKD